MTVRQIGKLVPQNSALLICDMQEKFRPTISKFASIVNATQKLFNTSRHLELPILVTEHYPEKLGRTIPEMSDAFCDHNIPIFTKKQFSMVTPELSAHLKAQPRPIKSVLLCGIESHACVLNTALDLMTDEQHYDVHLVVDATSSRNPIDRKFAIKRAAQSGAFLVTTEMAILQLLCGADHPKFKTVQREIMEIVSDTGLD